MDRHAKTFKWNTALYSICKVVLFTSRFHFPKSRISVHELRYSNNLLYNETIVDTEEGAHV